MQVYVLRAGVVFFLMFTLFATGPAEAAIHNIDVGSFFFSPTNTQVCPGDTVRWTWVSGLHSSTSDLGSPKAWDSGTFGTVGHLFDVVFLEADGPGPFPYHCSVHSLAMKDTIWFTTDCLPAFTCGDANGSGEVDIDDVVFLINYIFGDGPAPNPLESGDANCSADVDIDDVVYLIAYIFSGGNGPCDTDGDEVPDC